jgi:hypothetical protein
MTRNERRRMSIGRLGIVNERTVLDADVNVTLILSTSKARKEVV